MSDLNTLNQNALSTLKEVEAMINEEGDRHYKGSLSPEELQAFLKEVEAIEELCDSIVNRFA